MTDKFTDPETAGQDGTGVDRPETTRRDATRRRLLKGASLAAPAVFTLPSAASAIAFGSITTCVRKTEEQPENFHVGLQDRWARKAVPAIHVVCIDDASNDDWLSTSEGDRRVLVHYGRDMYVDGNNQQFSRNRDGYYVDHRGRRYREVSGVGERYTVAFVSDDGKLLGMHPRNRFHGRAVTGSCWISLLPNI